MLGVVVLAAATLSSTACRDWREAVIPGLANPQPQQALLRDRSPQPLPGHPGVTFTPRARYQNRAWAVALDDAPDDAWAEVVPLDVALAWGPVANPGVLTELSLHLKRRYVSVRWSHPLPLSEQDVMRHLSNHHLIPSTPAVMTDLEMIRPGDLVTLDGLLVDLDGPAGRMATSLSRTDVGNGACEVVYVERVEVARPE